MTDAMTVLHGRAGGIGPDWQIFPGAEIHVAEDRAGVAALLIWRHDLVVNRIFADQLEGQRKDNRPTIRGIKGMMALGRFIEGMATEQQAKVFTGVALTNTIHIRALMKLGWIEEITVLTKDFSRGPKPPPSPSRPDHPGPECRPLSA